MASDYSARDQRMFLSDYSKTTTILFEKSEVLAFEKSDRAEELCDYSLTGDLPSRIKFAQRIFDQIQSSLILSTLSFHCRSGQS